MRFKLLGKQQCLSARQYIRNDLDMYHGIILRIIGMKTEKPNSRTLHLHVNY